MTVTESRTRRTSNIRSFMLHDGRRAFQEGGRQWTFDARGRRVELKAPTLVDVGERLAQFFRPILKDYRCARHGRAVELRSWSRTLDGFSFEIVCAPDRVALLHDPLEPLANVASSWCGVLGRVEVTPKGWLTRKRISASEPEAMVRLLREEIEDALIRCRRDGRVSDRRHQDDLRSLVDVPE